MSKPKILQKDKRQLIKIFKAEQKEKWCELSKKIHDEGKVLTSELDERITSLNREISSMQNELWSLQNQRTTILKNNKLLLNYSMDHYMYGSSYSCKLDDVHLDVIEFINEYREKEKELLLIGNEE